VDFHTGLRLRGLGGLLRFLLGFLLLPLVHQLLRLALALFVTRRAFLRRELFEHVFVHLGDRLVGGLRLAAGFFFEFQTLALGGFALRFGRAATGDEQRENEREDYDGRSHGWVRRSLRVRM